MTQDILTRLLEHNHWANLQVLDACEMLSDEQLDFQPQSAVRGTIRDTLQHLVTSQEDYACMATTFDHPPERIHTLSFTEMREIATQSGQTLLSIAPTFAGATPPSQITLTDGYRVDPWVILVQVINHATEHREQIKSIMTTLGVAPPRIDGWRFGREVGSLIPPSV